MHLCIIDDDPIYQFAFSRILKKIEPDADIMSFANGELALNQCKVMLGEKAEIPSVIFLDLNMPVMDGWNFLDEFIKLHHHELEKTKVYIVSSSVHHEDMEKAKQYSVVTDYVVKPMTKDKILSILDQNR